MRSSVAAFALVLFGAATTSFVGARWDPEYDDAASIEELAAVDPSNAVSPVGDREARPADVRLPRVGIARAVPRDPWRRDGGVGPASDFINVALSPTALRVNGREVLRLPADLSHGIAPLQTEHFLILPLVQAIAFERQVMKARHAAPVYANLYVDESIPYRNVLELVRSLDLDVRFVVRTDAGLGFVSVFLSDGSTSEFAPPITLRDGTVTIVDTFPPVDGHVDQVGIRAQLERPKHDVFREYLTALVHGTPRFVDLVALLAVLDVVSEETAPRWADCGELPNCYAALHFGRATKGEVHPWDDGATLFTR